MVGEGRAPGTYSHGDGELFPRKRRVRCPYGVMARLSYAGLVTPETRYARAGNMHIAYQLLGEGPVDVVLADQWFSNMDGRHDGTMPTVGRGTAPAIAR